MRKASKGLLEELAGLAVMDDKLVPPRLSLPSATFFVGCRASRTGFSGCRLCITSRCSPPSLAAPYHLLAAKRATQSLAGMKSWLVWRS